MGVKRERGANQGVELPDLRLPIGGFPCSKHSASTDRIELGPFGLSLDDGLSPPSLAHAFKNFSAEYTVFRARM